MKMLITGSSGMLGTELCQVLRNKYELVGIDLTNPKSEIRNPERFYELGITDSKKVGEIFDEEKPELVIHTAAWTDVDGCELDPEKAYNVNTLGTENIAKASKAGNVPVIFISTDFVFDGKKKTPYVEDDIPNPLSVYGKTKWEAEKIIERMLTLYVIVRTSWLYGESGKNFVDTIINKSKIQSHIRVVNDQIGSPTYAKDLSRAVLKLIEVVKIKNKDIFHISNIGMCSWYDFAEKILEYTKIESSSIEPIKTDQLARPAPRPSFSVLDNSKFERTIGHKMRPWQEALREYIRERHKVGSNVLGEQ